VLIQSEEQYKNMLSKIDKGPPVMVYDLETTGLNPYLGDRLIGIAILIPDLSGETDGESFYVPFRHKRGKNLPINELYHLAPFLADPKRVLIGFNIKFDIHFTEIEGISVFNQIVDVMLGAHLCNENEMSFALKKLGSKYIDKDAAKEEIELIELLKKHKLKKEEMDNLLPEKVAPYAEKDVVLTWQLAKFYQDQLIQQGLVDMWWEVNKYCKAITDMERRGVLIDPIKCSEHLKSADTKRQEVHQKMVELVGHDFNPNSVPQLRKILNQKETDRKALKKTKHPVAPLLLEYRGWDRAINTYYQSFLDSMDENYRIHPNLNIHGTVSGRLSCTKPNLQALPKGKDQYKVRELVVAPPGYVLMSWDWSQVELRLLAHYTKDPLLLNAFRENKDIHQATSERLKIDRSEAKRINFSIVYGIGVNGLAENLGITKKEAEKYLNQYHSMIPGIKKLYNIAERIAIRDQKLPMWTGRLRHYRKEDATHKAMSNLIQGGVAEMMRIAITRLDEVLKGTRAHMILQVHDEILFEIPEEEVNCWIPVIKEIMEDFPFEVPIKVESKIGYSWGHMEPVTWSNESKEPVVPDLGERCK